MHQICKIWYQNAARYCLIESEVRPLYTRPWLTLKTITVWLYLDLPSLIIIHDYIIVSCHNLLSMDKGFELHIELLLFRCHFWINVDIPISRKSLLVNIIAKYFISQIYYLIPYIKSTIWLYQIIIRLNKHKRALYRPAAQQPRWTSP